MDEICGWSTATRPSTDTIPSRPVSAVVSDYQTLRLPGEPAEFVTVVKRILTGQRYEPPNQPVCVECKLNDQLCVFEKGLICMGR